MSPAARGFAVAAQVRPRRFRFWIAAALWVAAAGCGHQVTPTAEFRDPESIPLPEDLQAVSFQGSVAVSWFTVPEIFAFVDGWHVYRATGEAIPQPEDYLRINGELVLSNEYRDDDVSDGTRYWYVVTSWSPAGIESVPTEPVSVRVDATAPDAPVWIEAVIRFNEAFNRYEAVVTWAETAAADLDHYNLHRAPGIPSLPVVPDLIETRWVDDTVKADSTYSYWVTAVDGNLNESVAADTVTVTVPGPMR